MSARAYFNVPYSQRNLRVRDRRRPPAPPVERDDPLEQLIVVPPAAVPAVIHDDARALATTLALDSAHLDPRFADDECEHGRLPGDRTAPCGCWAQESGTVPTHPEERPQPVGLAGEAASERVSPVPDPPILPPPDVIPAADPIPEWVLADAAELYAHGWTWTRVARAVLPATGCPDVPSCAELLKVRLRQPKKVNR